MDTQSGASLERWNASALRRKNHQCGQPPAVQPSTLANPQTTDCWRKPRQNPGKPTSTSQATLGSARACDFRMAMICFQIRRFHRSIRWIEIGRPAPAVSLPDLQPAIIPNTNYDSTKFIQILDIASRDIYNKIKILYLLLAMKYYHRRQTPSTSPHNRIPTSRSDTHPNRNLIHSSWMRSGTHVTNMIKRRDSLIILRSNP